MDDRLAGPLADPAGEAGHTDHPERVGFFTDTSVCIGCKACEVACKEWNLVPEAGPLDLLGTSYDNTGALGADTWRHVAFIEQRTPADGAQRTEAVASTTGNRGQASPEDGLRWLMASDVCKHCTHAACLDVCPTGSLFRTEYGTVVVQADICNGCGYCVPACPYGVIDVRAEDGRAFKCTLCYDRLGDGLEPACAKACPTDSIQFGPLDELRERADRRLRELRDLGVDTARLYGRDPDDGVGGDGAFFLLLDEPEVYGLPPDPVVTTRDLPQMWRYAALAAVGVAAGVVLSFAGPVAGRGCVGSSDALTGLLARSGSAAAAGLSARSRAALRARLVARSGPTPMSGLAARSTLAGRSTPSTTSARVTAAAVAATVAAVSGAAAAAFSVGRSLLRRSLNGCVDH